MATGDPPGSRRRRLLLISYHFDVETEIGSRRARLFSRYLPSVGWDVTIVTSGNPSMDRTDPSLVVRHVPTGSVATKVKTAVGIDAQKVREVRGGLAAAGLRGRLRLVGAAIADFVPETLSWSRRATRLARSEAAIRPVDAILSTGPPHTTHLAAWWLTSSLGVPWLAEFRDLWSQNADRGARRARRYVDRWVERLLLRRPRALVTVSTPLADRLRREHRHVAVHAIPTGFDPAETAPADQTVSSTFLLVYTGRIYPGYQHLVLILRPLRRAIDSGLIDRAKTRVDLILVEPLDAADGASIDQLHLRDVVNVVPTLTHSEAVGRQREAQILLHMRWDDPDQPGVTTGKLAEYLAARRPILSTGQYVDQVVETISATGAGVATCTEDETVEFLSEAYRQFRDDGRVAFRGDIEVIGRLDAEGMARSLGTLLASVTSS